MEEEAQEFGRRLANEGVGVFGVWRTNPLLGPRERPEALRCRPACAGEGEDDTGVFDCPLTV